jgi:hypothetical protein
MWKAPCDTVRSREILYSRNLDQPTLNHQLPGVLRSLLEVHEMTFKPFSSEDGGLGFVNS